MLNEQITQLQPLHRKVFGRRRKPRAHTALAAKERKSIGRNGNRLPRHQNTVHVYSLIHPTKPAPALQPRKRPPKSARKAPTANQCHNKPSKTALAAYRPPPALEPLSNAKKAVSGAKTAHQPGITVGSGLMGVAHVARSA